MARLLEHLIERPRTCSYLPEERAALEYMTLQGVTPEEFDAMLARGWRRFGTSYFRPACAACEKCVPTRIVLGPAPELSRSQRRALTKTAHLRMVVGVPTVDPVRLALYRKWHKDREHARDWSPSSLDARMYAQEFAHPHPCVREVAYLDGDRLVGVEICDETPTAWSSVYFYFDPEYAKLSMGIANVLRTCELARSRGARFLYLGFSVAACPSLAYKSKFFPQETLVGRPAFDEAPVWTLSSPGH